MGQIKLQPDPIFASPGAAVRFADERRVAGSSYTENSPAFPGDCLLWDAEESGIRILRAADRTRWLGANLLDRLSEENLTDLKTVGRYKPLSITPLAESDAKSTAPLLFWPIGEPHQPVWLVLTGTETYDPEGLRPILIPEEPDGNVIDSNRLADALADWCPRLAAFTGCGLDLDLSGLRIGRWVFPFSADALVAALIAALLEARVAARDRTLGLRFFTETESGITLLRVTLLLRGTWSETPTWKKLAEAGSWICSPEASEPGEKAYTLRAYFNQTETMGLKQRVFLRNR